ncbi:MAG: hypothetical protein HXX17_16895 [Geobacteraceae bacterium]|nr:hypothetical protein [Geobacteraceae bacterium]
MSSTITTGINTTAGSTTANAGNISVAVASGSGAGRFPGGGARWSGTPATSQNPGGWWFQTTTNDVTTNPGAYGTNCHNSATSGGGTTWAPKEQRWNKKSPW